MIMVGGNNGVDTMSPILGILESAPKMDARTAWAQIPTMTKMACGARHPIAATNHLQMTVGKRGLRLFITLTPNDTYNVYLVSTLGRTGDALKIKATVTDVYCDTLGEVVYHLVNK